MVNSPSCAVETFGGIRAAENPIFYINSHSSAIWNFNFTASCSHASDRIAFAIVSPNTVIKKTLDTCDMDKTLPYACCSVYDDNPELCRWWVGDLLYFYKWNLKNWLYPSTVWILCREAWLLPKFGRSTVWPNVFGGNSKIRCWDCRTPVLPSLRRRYWNVTLHGWKVLDWDCDEMRPQQQLFLLLATSLQAWVRAHFVQIRTILAILKRKPCIES